MINRILLGMSYLTWIICNISIIYGLGYSIIFLFKVKNIGSFLLYLAIGSCTLMLLIVISFLLLYLITLTFGNDDEIKRLENHIPFLNN